MVQPYRIVLVAAIVAAVVSCATLSATASPLSQTQAQAAKTRAEIDALDGRLVKTAADYQAASARVTRLERANAGNSAKLDELVAALDKLQERLDSRAADMYRSGPYAFVEVLAGATSFDQFVSTWDLLTELSRQDARMIDDVRKARVAAVTTARTLQSRQSAAAGQLRAVDAARTQAAADLAKRKSLLATYTGKISALKAEQAASAAAVTQAAPVGPAPDSLSAGSAGSAGSSSAGGSSAGPSGGTPGGTPSGAVSGRTGSGAWKSGNMSWFGPGFYGQRMAGGQVLHPDSMVVAHRTLPFGTLVEFSYRGRRAVATVADRGPFHSGREFDLGPGVARVLGFDGVGVVQYRIIGR